jgi:four helix bundle protein
MVERPKKFEEWEKSVPERIKNNHLWNSVFYRKALFLYDLCWFDCELLMHDMRGRAVAEQIIRSAGSISANMEEGYGRGFGRDYARFLKFAIGSARETQGWYTRARHLLRDETVEHRLQLCDEIISLLIPTINQQQNR